MIDILLLLLGALPGTFLGWFLCILWARRHRMALTTGIGTTSETVYVVPSLWSFLPRRIGKLN